MRAATGMTVLVTTHYMDEAEQYCDRVALMHRGRIRALGTPDRAHRARWARPDADLDDVFRDSPAATSTRKEGSFAMSVAPAAPPAAWADGSAAGLARAAHAAARRVVAMCLVELQKLRHDRTELVTRAVQPAPVAADLRRRPSPGSTRSPPAASPTSTSWRPASSPSRRCSSSIFYGIQIIWERDAGVLAKLMVTPTPRAALVTGKASPPACGR